MSMQNKSSSFLILLLSLVVGFANEQEPAPTLESVQLETICSENGRLKFIFFAPKALHYESGDKAYPEGIRISFYQPEEEEEGAERVVSVTGRANSAYYWAESKVYEFRGDVEIKSIREQRQLNTDELYFDPQQETFYTYKFIRVETAHDVLMGEGLTAQQDLSYYSVLQPQGRFQADAVSTP